MDALILSNALDTNGQNSRYQRAASRWGEHENVVKALALGPVDPAGVVGRFQIAADKFASLSIRSAHRAEAYFEFPRDILWDRRSERLVRQLAHEADVIHLNNSWRPWQRLNLKLRKPLLLHHHGSLFRSDPQGMLNWARQHHAVQAVSTIDLTLAAPHVLHWLPTAYDIDELLEFGEANRRDDDDDALRVVHAPTNREIKSTDTLIAVVEQLRQDGANIELVLVESRPWAECMTIKATADVYFDQVKLGYGCNAIESWAMNVPVIAGADELTLNAMRKTFDGTLPFYVASEDTIADALTAMLSKRTRTKYAKLGLAHVRRWHDELPALTRLAELYSKTISVELDTHAVVEYGVARFNANVPQVHVAGQFVTFVDGVFETTNPYLATRLRQLSQRKPQFGITEQTT